MVEGWSEEILIPTLAKKIGINLAEKGVSIVNVGSSAFLRYSKIFQRKNDPFINMPVAVITDIDIKPEDEDSDLQTKIKDKKDKYSNQKVQGFVSPHWTLEYCLGSSPILAPYLFEATKKALREMRSDGNNTNAEITDSYEVRFGGKDQKDIAFEIYKNLIIEKRISKTVIAQQLAKILEENIKRETLETSINKGDKSIKYLIDAIKYATNRH